MSVDSRPCSTSRRFLYSPLSMCWSRSSVSSSVLPSTSGGVCGTGGGGGVRVGCGQAPLDGLEERSAHRQLAVVGVGAGDHEPGRVVGAGLA